LAVILFSMEKKRAAPFKLRKKEKGEEEIQKARRESVRKSAPRRKKGKNGKNTNSSQP